MTHDSWKILILNHNCKFLSWIVRALDATHLLTLISQDLMCSLGTLAVRHKSKTHRRGWIISTFIPSFILYLIPSFIPSFIPSALYWACKRYDSQKGMDNINMNGTPSNLLRLHMRSWATSYSIQMQTRPVTATPLGPAKSVTLSKMSL